VVVDMPPMFAGQEFDKLEMPIINCSLTYTNAKEPYMEGRLRNLDLCAWP